MKSDPIRVLLVTDGQADAQRSHAKDVENILTQLSYKVTVARSKPEIYHQLKDGAFDLFLLDHEPSKGFDARPLLEQLAKEKSLSHIPSVVMSFQDDQDTVASCLHEGADGFLTKPCRRNELNNLWVHVWRSSLQRSESAGPAAGTASVFKRRGTSSSSGGDEGSGNGSSATGSLRSDTPSPTEYNASALTRTSDQPAQTAGAGSNGERKPTVIKPSAFKAYTGSQVVGKKRPATEPPVEQPWNGVKYQGIAGSVIQPAAMPPAFDPAASKPPPVQPPVDQRKVATTPVGPPPPGAHSQPVPVPRQAVLPVPVPPAPIQRPGPGPPLHHYPSTSKPQHPANVAMLQGGSREVRQKLPTQPRKHPANEAMELEAGGYESVPFPACSITRAPHPANEAMLRETSARGHSGTSLDHLSASSRAVSHTHPANTALVVQETSRLSANSRTHPANAAMMAEAEKAQLAKVQHVPGYPPSHPMDPHSPHHAAAHPAAYHAATLTTAHMQAHPAAHPSPAALYPGHPPHPHPFEHSHPIYPPPSAAVPPHSPHASKPSVPPYPHPHVMYPGAAESHSNPFYPAPHGAPHPPTRPTAHPHSSSQASAQSYQQTAHHPGMPHGLYPPPTPHAAHKSPIPPPHAAHTAHLEVAPHGIPPHTAHPHSMASPAPPSPSTAPSSVPSAPSTVSPTDTSGTPLPPAYPGAEPTAVVPGRGSGSGEGAGSGDSGGNGMARAGSNGDSTISIALERYQARHDALKKYQSKKESRCFEKKILYNSRKQLAEARPRVQGKFTRSSSKSSSDDTHSKDTKDINSNGHCNGNGHSDYQDKHRDTTSTNGHSACKQPGVPNEMLDRQFSMKHNGAREYENGLSGNSDNSHSAEC